jgi:ribonuclease-3
MTKIRSRIVNRDIINQLAISMGINNILVNNVNSIHNSNNLYGDALEALIGVIFIDKGFRKTKKIFIERVLNKYLDLNSIINNDTNYKSLIFEWVQKNKAKLSFTYNEGYDSLKKELVFYAILSINGEEYGRGQGKSKKEAEQEASNIACNRITNLSIHFE